MKILAVDQARNGAWAVFDYETKELITYGTFSFGTKEYTFAEALVKIVELIEDVIIKNGISAIFIEDIQMRVNVQSFKRLAQLQGALITLFQKNDYLYDYVAPATWQSFCGARGRKDSEIKAKILSISKTKGKKNSKALSIEYVKDKYNIDTENDNLADAICIGTYVVNNITISTNNE